MRKQRTLVPRENQGERIKTSDRSYSTDASRFTRLSKCTRTKVRRNSTREHSRKHKTCQASQSELGETGKAREDADGRADAASSEGRVHNALQGNSMKSYPAPKSTPAPKNNSRSAFHIFGLFTHCSVVSSNCVSLSSTTRKYSLF